MTIENNEAPKIGESDHDKAMMDLADGKTTEAPVEGEVEEQGEGTDNTDDRPTWLPEKFKSPEDMAKAYSELEKKLGKPPEDEAPTTDEEGETTDGEEGDDEAKEADKDDDQSEEGPALDFTKYSNELNEKGELSAETYEELAKAGLPKEIVNEYIELQRDKQASVDQRFIDTAGGQDQLKSVVEWAKENAPKALRVSFDRAYEAGDVDTAHDLFSQITESYKNATGFEGKSVSGTPAPSTGEVFESQAQVTKAMSDPRYSGPSADPAYIKSVEAKLMRSKNII